MNEIILVVASSLVGLFVAGLIWWIGAILSAKRFVFEDRSFFEADRIERVRESSSTFRQFEPQILEFEKFNHVMVSETQQEQTKHAMAFLGSFPNWRSEELIAVKRLEGLLIGLVLGAFAWFTNGSVVLALFVVAACFLFYPSFALFLFSSQAQTRLHKIRRRIPFAVDLLALMMEAGAGFMESLETVVNENKGHPLGEELARVLRQVQMGRPRSEALDLFGDRINDEDVKDFVFAVNNGEKLGTPLSKILRSQAETMRLKRSQWAEKDSAQAQVKMVFPGIIVMIACMLIVLGQFLLPAIEQFRSSMN